MYLELVDLDHEQGAVYRFVVKRPSVQEPPACCTTLKIELEHASVVIPLAKTEDARAFALALMAAVSALNVDQSSRSTQFLQELRFSIPEDPDSSILVRLTAANHLISFRVLLSAGDNQPKVISLSIPSVYAMLLAQALVSSSVDDEMHEYAGLSPHEGLRNCALGNSLLIPSLVEGKILDECVPHPEFNTLQPRDMETLASVRKQTQEWLQNFTAPSWISADEQIPVRRGAYFSHSKGHYTDKDCFWFCLHACKLDSPCKEICKGDSDFYGHHYCSVTRRNMLMILRALEGVSLLNPMGVDEHLVLAQDLISEVDDDDFDQGKITIKSRGNCVVVEFEPLYVLDEANRILLPFHVAATLIHYFRALEHMYATVDDEACKPYHPDENGCDFELRLGNEPKKTNNPPYYTSAKTPEGKTAFLPGENIPWDFS